MTESDARERASDLRRFYWHLLSYIGINGAFVTGALVAGDPELLVGPLLVALSWGGGLAVHATRALDGAAFWSRQWHERKVRELMARDAALPARPLNLHALPAAYREQIDGRILQRLDNLEAIVAHEDWDVTDTLRTSEAAPQMTVDLDPLPDPSESTGTPTPQVRG